MINGLFFPLKTINFYGYVTFKHKIKTQNMGLFASNHSEMKMHFLMRLVLPSAPSACITGFLVSEA